MRIVEIREKTAPIASPIANAYMDATSGGASLTAAAKKVGMQTGRVAAMDASGLAPDGGKAAIPDDPLFREQAFKAEAGEDGDPSRANRAMNSSCR